MILSHQIIDHMAYHDLLSLHEIQLKKTIVFDLLLAF